MSAQGLLYFVHRVGGFLSDEIERYMHRLRTHPPHLRRKPSAPCPEKLLQTRANGIVDIERNKDTHRKVVSRSSIVVGPNHFSKILKT